MPEFSFESPQTLVEACQMLTAAEGKLIAGGTDVIPQMRDGRFQPDRLIDLSRLPNLSYVDQHNDTITIGALTNYTTMLNSRQLQTEAPLLVAASGLVGGIQTQNRGTLGGNIANASPAGDTHPPLLALDAEVTLTGTGGDRTVPLADLLQGPGQTAISASEIIRHVSFKRLADGMDSTFMRLGNRGGMVISVVSVAVVLRLGPGSEVKDVRIALGAVAPTAIRCHQAESILLGQKLTATLVDEAAGSASRECSPIDDVRGTADYRRHGVKILVRRGLGRLAGTL
jgi:CO/xanthine dehydrogenase FAD-binding subunit